MTNINTTALLAKLREVQKKADRLQSDLVQMQGDAVEVSCQIDQIIWELADEIKEAELREPDLPGGEA